MRLLHVIHTLNPASGGTAEAVRTFVSHCGDSSQEVLTLDASTDTWDNALPVRTHCVGPGKTNYGYIRRLPAWLQANLRAYDAAVIHGCWQFHGFSTARIARAMGTPYFVFPHGMLDPYFNSISRAKHLKKLLYWRFERAVLENARAVFFTCAEERDRSHHGFRFKSADEVVPLGVVEPPVASESRSAFLDHFPQLKGKRVLLFLGRLHPKKGIDLLLRAFCEVADPALHLVIAGPAHSQEYLQELQHLAARCPTPVTFTGMLTGNLKAGALATSEALVLPSHQENFGLSVIEGLAYGKPALLSDQVNIWRELVGDGAALVASDTLPGLTDLLRRWTSLSEEERFKMGLSAKQCFESRFRAESASNKFTSIIRNFIGRSHDRSRSSLQFIHA